MKPRQLRREREILQEKVKDLRQNISRLIERKRFFGLDYQVRQVQKQFTLLGRI